MSRYTTLIRWIVESYSFDKPFISVAERIAIASPHIFDFAYPVWKESERRAIEAKILRRFYMKEICEDTVGLWKIRLEDWCNTELPFYNNLYLTAEKKFDYLQDVDVTETFTHDKNATRTEKGDEETTSNSKTNSQSNTTYTDSNAGNWAENKSESVLNSDLPQVNYGGVDYGTGMSENKANNIGNNRADTNGTNENKLTSGIDGNSKLSKLADTTDTEKIETTKTVNGVNGARSKSELLAQYRKTIINIDSMMLDSLEPLFMTIYS